MEFVEDMKNGMTFEATWKEKKNYFGTPTNRKVSQEAETSNAIDHKFTNKYTHIHVDIFAPNTLSSVHLYTCYMLHKFGHT